MHADPVVSLLPVTQADREAAASYHRDMGGAPTGQRRITAGEFDSEPEVQAFARHRLAHHTPAPAGDVQTLNINDHVWVKLTDEGRAYHHRWYSRRYSMLEYRAPKEDADGWSRWQLWDLMASFGEGIHMGGRLPFETTIRLASTTTDTSAVSGSAGLREALKLCAAFIRMVKQDGVELFGTGIHTGLRKGTEAENAMDLWRFIADSKTTAWPDALAFAIDPFFTMWGGDEALDAAAKALTEGQQS